MTGSAHGGVFAGNPWRIARWTMAGILLLTPAVMMRISHDWNWSIGDFVVAATMIGGVGLLYELSERISASRAYRAGAGLALLTAFLTIWATFVRDDGNGIGFFMVVLAAMVGAFAAWFRAAGMARAMLGVAAMQALLGVALATAPDVAAVPGMAWRMLVFCSVFATLWLGSALLFAAAARGSGGAR